MSDIKELKDDDLELVNGGGSGALPAGGITFSTYSSVSSGCYYSKYMNFDDVVYVYTSQSEKFYSPEKFIVDQAAGTWSSYNIDPLDNYFVKADFGSKYPYRLNVRP